MFDQSCDFWMDRGVETRPASESPQEKTSEVAPAIGADDIWNRPVRRHSDGRRRRLTNLSPAAVARRTIFIGGSGVEFIVGGGCVRAVESTNDRYSTICDYKSTRISSFLFNYHTINLLSSGSFGNNKLTH